MFGKRKPENLSVEELEKLLLIKKRQSRMERFQQLSAEKRSVNEALLPQETAPPPLVPPPTSDGNALSSSGFQAATMQPLRGKQKKYSKVKGERTRSKKIMDALLLGLEAVALIGLVGVLAASYFNLRELNDEVAIAQQNVVEQQIPPTPTVTPPIALAARLPGGHTPPTSPGGAVPDVPFHLQEWVQPAAASSISAAAIPVMQSQQPPTRLVIPKINVDAPIIGGVKWNDLKKGVGHLPGSANPGERGNLYLAAHNDIFGEIFRYLEELEPGDTYTIYANEQKYRYVVKEKRIIKPTEVEVMLPTTEPVATLQTCYPYLIDSHRLVIIGELAQ